MAGVNIGNTLDTLNTIETGINNNKVVKFAYTQDAYDDNDVNGVTEYDVENENNIPTSAPEVIKVNETVISKGFRNKASSLTRMLMNHIFGRVSYNLNKIHDNFQSLLTVLRQGFHPVYFGTCDSSHGSYEKVIDGLSNFVAEEGARIYVRFKNYCDRTVDEDGNIELIINGNRYTVCRANRNNNTSFYMDFRGGNYHLWENNEIVEFVITQNAYEYASGLVAYMMKPINVTLNGGVLYVEY